VKRRPTVDPPLLLDFGPTREHYSLDTSGLPGGASEGTWAARPGSPGAGAIYYLTDAPSMAYYSSGAWKHRWGTEPVTPPVIGEFAQVNFGTSTTPALGPFVTLTPQRAASYALRVLDKAAPATPYTIEWGAHWPMQFATGNFQIGCGWRESGSGLLVLAYVDTTNPVALLRVAKFNSATSINSTYYSQSVSPCGSMLKLRIRDDGASRYVDVNNGGAWTSIHDVARTDFITADRVCAFIGMEVSSLQTGINWIHWDES
jgi:hypothetical protein